jgi:PAS domain S-box-containing protein/putative nucleotidyltransferase with HDIG domain
VARKSRPPRIDFQQLLETLPEGIRIINLDYTVAWANEALARMAGVDPASVQGQKCYEVFPGEGCHTDGCPVTRLLTGENKIANQYDKVRSTGGHIPCLVVAKPLKDKSGRIVGILQNFRDLTAIKEGKEALKKSRDLYRLLAENVRDIIWTMDLDLRLTYVSPSVQFLSGYTPEECLHLTLKEMLTPASLQSVRARFAMEMTLEESGAAEEGRSPTLELEHKCKDGSTVWAEVKTNFLKDAQGRLVGVMGVTRDITERRRMEEALRESEEHFRHIFYQAPVGAAIVSPDYRFQRVNQELCRITGYSEAELCARTFTDVTHPEDLPTDLVQVKRLAQGEIDHYQREKRYIRKDGHPVWVRVTVRPMRDEEGEPIYFLPMMEDITARKKAELEVDRQAALLQGINQVFREALTCDSEAELGRTCLKVAEGLTGSRFGFIGEVNPVGRLDTIAMSNPGWEACGLPETDKPRLINNVEIRGLLAKVLEEGQAVLTNQVANHPDYAGVPSGHPVLTSFLGVPLRHRKKIFGMLALANKESGYETGDLEAGENLGVAVVEALMRKRAEENLQHSMERLRKVLGEIVQAMAITVEIRDQFTSGHQRRVAQLAQAIAAKINLPLQQREGLWVAGTLHDLGKIYIPESILSRPGKLTDIEMTFIRTHPQVGYDILKTIEFPWPVAQIVLQHHERLDGSGYPQGLRGPDILPEARILAVADVVEAMASHRPYLPAVGLDEALAEISRFRGVLYDPQVVDACLQLFQHQGFQFEAAMGLVGTSSDWLQVVPKALGGDRA